MITARLRIGLILIIAKFFSLNNKSRRMKDWQLTFIMVHIYNRFGKDGSA